MNGMLDVQDASRENHNQDSSVYEENTMNHRVSFSETVSRSIPGEARKSQQKFKSRHFPEPFWGHDD